MTRVLVIDSYQDTAWSLATALAMEGLQTRYADCVAAGLELFGLFEPHAVVIDFELRDGGADSFCNSIKTHKQSREPTLVALSGWRDLRHLALARLCGIHYYLLKPAAVESVIQAVLGRSPRRLQAAE